MSGLLILFHVVAEPQNSKFRSISIKNICQIYGKLKIFQQNFPPKFPQNRRFFPLNLPMKIPLNLSFFCDPPEALICSYTCHFWPVKHEPLGHVIDKVFVAIPTCFVQCAWSFQILAVRKHQSIKCHSSLPINVWKAFLPVYKQKHKQKQKQNNAWWKGYRFVKSDNNIYPTQKLYTQFSGRGQYSCEKKAKKNAGLYMYGIQTLDLAKTSPPL